MSDGKDEKLSKARRVARSDKTRYDILCAACGAAAQVPFKPAPGRRVFCHPCHLARRATRQGEGSEAQQGIHVGDDESGIVE